MVQSADQVTGALADWLGARFPDCAVALDDAAAQDGRAVIRIDLADLSIEAGAGRLPATTVLRLDYLIRVEAGDMLVVHRHLGEIAFALADAPVLPAAEGGLIVFRLDRREGGPLGIRVSTSLPRSRALPAAPPVLHAPTIRADALATIEGVVCGPDGRAVAGAVVELPSLSLVQTTGTDGRFRFSAPERPDRPLELIARKHRFSATLAAAPGQAVTLHLSAES